MAATRFSGPIYVGGVEVIDENGNIDAPVTTTNLTTSGTTTLGDSTSDTTTINGKINLAKIGGAAASASGLIMGVGTSADPATTSTADAIFSEFRTESTATSGDSRSFYLRHSINGAGGGGEALRAFAKIDAAGATARGAHISVDLAAAGSLSGFGAGVDAQVLYGDTSYSSTLSAINAELYASGSSTDITAGASSVFRVNVGGDSTGVGNLLDKAAFISFTNAAGGGDLVDSNITALTGKAGLRVYVNGSLYGYIPIVTGS